MWTRIFVLLFILIVSTAANQLSENGRPNSYSKEHKKLAKQPHYKRIRTNETNTKLTRILSDAATVQHTCKFYSMAAFSVVCNDYSENTGIEVDTLVRVRPEKYIIFMHVEGRLATAGQTQSQNGFKI